MSTETKTSFKATDVSTDEKRVDGRLVAWSEGVEFVPKGARIGWDLLWSDVEALFTRSNHLVVRTFDDRSYELDVENPKGALKQLRSAQVTARRSTSSDERTIADADDSTVRSVDTFSVSDASTTGSGVNGEPTVVDDEVTAIGGRPVRSFSVANQTIHAVAHVRRVLKSTTVPRDGFLVATDSGLRFTPLDRGPITSAWWREWADVTRLELTKQGTVSVHVRAEPTRTFEVLGADPVEVQEFAGVLELCWTTYTDGTPSSEAIAAGQSMKESITASQSAKGDFAVDVTFARDDGGSYVVTHVDTLPIGHPSLDPRTLVSAAVVNGYLLDGDFVAGRGAVLLTTEAFSYHPTTSAEARVPSWEKSWALIDATDVDRVGGARNLSFEYTGGSTGERLTETRRFQLPSPVAGRAVALFESVRNSSEAPGAAPHLRTYLARTVPAQAPATEQSLVTFDDRALVAVDGRQVVPTTLDPDETVVWAGKVTQMTNPASPIPGALVATSKRLLLLPNADTDGRWGVEWTDIASVTSQKLPDDLKRAAKRSGLSIVAGLIGEQVLDFPGTGLAARYVLKKLKRWHVCVDLESEERQYLLPAGTDAKTAAATLETIRERDGTSDGSYVVERSPVTLAELVDEASATDGPSPKTTVTTSDGESVSAAAATESNVATVSDAVESLTARTAGGEDSDDDDRLPLREIHRLAPETVDRLAPDEQQAIRNLERLAERGLLPTVQYETSVLRTLSTAGISDREWFDWSLRAERQNEAGVVDGFLVTRSAGVQFVPVEPTAPTWAAAWDAVADVDLAFLDTVDGTAATDDVLLTVTAAGGRVESFVVGSDAGSSVDATVEALSSFVDRSTPAIGEDDVTPSVADGSASARGRRTSG